MLNNLSTNSFLKVLDISWNDLSQCEEALGNCLKMNTHLLHLDVSYTNLD
jgi:hypothetical protein